MTTSPGEVQCKRSKILHKARMLSTADLRELLLLRGLSPSAAGMDSSSSSAPKKTEARKRTAKGKVAAEKKDKDPPPAS